MRDPKREQEAVAAIARAMVKGWPARMVGKAAPGWAQVLLVALRMDPRGRDAVVAALLDEPPLAAALERARLPQGRDAAAVARHVLATLAGEQGV
ncbi:MAG: hypothetical protein M3P14_08150 [Chloroflexota bacterium]|nr:hypothetical protein [Chloroflexota bacterium]